jgi:hypothetical protein
LVRLMREDAAQDMIEHALIAVFIGSPARWCSVRWIRPSPRRTRLTIPRACESLIRPILGIRKLNPFMFSTTGVIALVAGTLAAGCDIQARRILTC